MAAAQIHHQIESGNLSTTCSLVQMNDDIPIGAIRLCRDRQPTLRSGCGLGRFQSCGASSAGRLR